MDGYFFVLTLLCTAVHHCSLSKHVQQSLQSSSYRVLGAASLMPGLLMLNLPYQRLQGEAWGSCRECKVRRCRQPMQQQVQMAPGGPRPAALPPRRAAPPQQISAVRPSGRPGQPLLPIKPLPEHLRAVQRPARRSQSRRRKTLRAGESGGSCGRQSCVWTVICERCHLCKRPRQAYLPGPSRAPLPLALVPRARGQTVCGDFDADLQRTPPQKVPPKALPS